MKDTPKIVILGAGMSAVACAENLIDSFQVELYEKSKGVGGRLCSKKYNGTRYHFGAQFWLIFETPLVAVGPKRAIQTKKKAYQKMSQK